MKDLDKISRLIESGIRHNHILAIEILKSFGWSVKEIAQLFLDNSNIDRNKELNKINIGSSKMRIAIERPVASPILDKYQTSMRMVGMGYWITGYSTATAQDKDLINFFERAIRAQYR